MLLLCQIVQHMLNEVWFIMPEYELCNSCMARRALFLIWTFITKKVYLWVSHRRCIFPCALSDVAHCLLYVVLVDIRCTFHVLFILCLLSLVSSGLLFLS